MFKQRRMSEAQCMYYNWFPVSEIFKVWLVTRIMKLGLLTDWLTDWLPELVTHLLTQSLIRLLTNPAIHFVSKSLPHSHSLDL